MSSETDSAASPATPYGSDPIAAGHRRWIAAASLVVFVLLAGYHLEVPGLQYDEVLFLNAALGGDSGQFVSLRWHGIPLMLMPYIGALKAWLYMPVLALFDVSAQSIRLPVIVIGVCTLALQYRLVLATFAAPAALIFVVLASLEPSTMFHTRLDWGPTTIMMLMRTLMLLHVLAWIRTPRPLYLYLVLLWFALGLFDKLNFAWFGPALGLALVLLYPRELLAFCRRHPGHVAGLAILVLMLLGALYYYSQHYLPLEGELGSGSEGRLLRVYNLLRGTLGGVLVHLVVVGQQSILFPGYLQLGALLVAALLAVLIWRVTPRVRTPWRPLGLILVTMAAVLVELALTRQAEGPHHMAVLAPLWLLPLAVLLGRAWHAEPHDARLLRPFALAATVMVGLTSLNLDLRYLRDFHGPTSPNWDTGSYTLAQTLADLPPQPVVTGDWGMANQLIGLLWDERAVYEYGGVFRDTPPEVNLDEMEALMQPQVLFVLPVPGASAFPQTRGNFFDAAARRGWRVADPVLVPGSNGAPLYEIYTVSAAQLAP